MLEFVKGDILETSADIRVNTVNCVGVMGAGVALAFKQRYPEMFKDYQRSCRNGDIKPGSIHVWKSLSGDWIINFPTKRDWRDPSRYEDIDAGLDHLRNYLDEVGPVTVALPALGCGHGGLDWTRVSDMIREKLDGVVARILVFEPSASRRAGRGAHEMPTDEERHRAERIGFTQFDGGDFAGLDTDASIYLMGASDTLSRKWIAVLPSRAPGEREFQALKAIASELARSQTDATVALVHGSRGSEEVSDVFAHQGIETVLLLPFGVLTRKSIAKRQASLNTPSRLTIASAVPPGAKWSRQQFAQSMEMLRANAAAILLSDPEPDWLTSKGLDKWGRTPISYVRYESTPHLMREALGSVGAKAIGRHRDDGAPKIDYLINTSQRKAAGTEDSANAAVRNAEDEAPNKLNAHNDRSKIKDAGESFTVLLDNLSEISRHQILEALLGMTTQKLEITIGLSHDALESDRRRLLDLGFCPIDRKSIADDQKKFIGND